MISRSFLITPVISCAKESSSELKLGELVAQGAALATSRFLLACPDGRAGLSPIPGEVCKGLNGDNCSFGLDVVGMGWFYELLLCLKIGAVTNHVNWLQYQIRFFQF